MYIYIYICVCVCVCVHKRCIAMSYVYLRDTSLASPATSGQGRGTWPPLLLCLLATSLGPTAAGEAPGLRYVIIGLRLNSNAWYLYCVSYIM